MVQLCWIGSKGHRVCRGPSKSLGRMEREGGRLSLCKNSEAARCEEHSSPTITQEVALLSKARVGRFGLEGDSGSSLASFDGRGVIQTLLVVDRMRVSTVVFVASVATTDRGAKPRAGTSRIAGESSHLGGFVIITARSRSLDASRFLRTRHRSVQSELKITPVR